MSLDIYFYTRVYPGAHKLYVTSKSIENDDIKLHDRLNITHNLTEMARAAELYEALWRPYRICGFSDEEEDKYDIQLCHLIPTLKRGIRIMETQKDYLIKNYSPENGWGTYSGLLEVTKQLLENCINYPGLFVEVSR